MSNEASNQQQINTELLGNSWNRFWFSPSDPIVLCLLRILIGVIALYLHVLYIFDLKMIVSSDGILPVQTVRQMELSAAEDPNSPAPVDYSIYSYFNDLRILNLLYGCGAVILVLYTLGIFTRVTSILAWLVFLFDIHRAPSITSEAETVMVFLLAYLCIAPCGYLFSVDYWLRCRKSQKNKQDESDTVHQPPLFWSATLATRLLQIHLTAVYLMMVAVKLNRAEWWDGTAVWFITAKNSSGWLEYSWLRSHSFVMNFLTHGIVIFQLTFGILIWQKKCRVFLVALSIPVWLGMAVITGNNVFCMTMLLANFVFLPPAVIYDLFRRRESKKVVVQSTTS